MRTPPIATLTEAELRRASGGGLMSTVRNLLAAAQSDGKVSMSDILVTSYGSTSSS